MHIKRTVTKRKGEKTDASLISNEIKEQTFSAMVYPTLSDIESFQVGKYFIPDLLCLLLEKKCSEKNSDVKIASLGQSNYTRCTIQSSYFSTTDWTWAYNCADSSAQDL